MAVFFKNIDTPSTPRSIEKSESSIQEQLASLRAELEKRPQDATERKEIQRKIKRLERLDALMEWKNMDEKSARDVSEILKGKNADTIKSSDILTLRKKGTDITNLTLINDVNPDKEIISSEIIKGDKFIVNFGNNLSLRDRTGAGDILPANIRKISINGVECERRNTPRPGYYNEKWRYQPIYDGYKIEVLTLWESSKEDLVANEKQWERERMRDTEDNNWIILSSLPEDRDLKIVYQKRQQERELRRKQYSNYNPENKEKFLSTFGDIVKRETEKYGIPQDLLVNNLFAKENAGFDPNLKNPYSSALWFWQIISRTWRFIESSILFEDLDRYNPEDQIKATCAYLNYIKNLKNCSWWDAIVYYHTWPGFNDSNVRTAMNVNAPIVAHMSNRENPTAKDYIEWAKKYYGITSQA